MATKQSQLTIKYVIYKLHEIATPPAAARNDTRKGGSYENSDQLHPLETGASSSALPRCQINQHMEPGIWYLILTKMRNE